MPEAYPPHLRTCLRAGKSRTQPAQFRLAEPRRGFGYVQPIGSDVPVFWDVSFRFTQAEALVFQTWFRFVIRGGIDPFTLPLRTEFGLITHECQFLPDSLMPAREDGELWSYSATIMARSLGVPDGYEEAAGLIVGLPDWPTWASILDEAMTAEMPGA